MSVKCQVKMNFMHSLKTFGCCDAFKQLKDDYNSQFDKAIELRKKEMKFKSPKPTMTEGIND